MMRKAKVILTFHRPVFKVPQREHPLQHAGRAVAAHLRIGAHAHDLREERSKKRLDACVTKMERSFISELKLFIAFIASGKSDALLTTLV